MSFYMFVTWMLHDWRSYVKYMYMYICSIKYLEFNIPELKMTNDPFAFADFRMRNYFTSSLWENGWMIDYSLRELGRNDNIRINHRLTFVYRRSIFKFQFLVSIIWNDQKSHVRKLVVCDEKAATMIRPEKIEKSTCGRIGKAWKLLDHSVHLELQKYTGCMVATTSDAFDRITYLLPVWHNLDYTIGRVWRDIFNKPKI